MYTNLSQLSSDDLVHPNSSNKIYTVPLKLTTTIHAPEKWCLEKWWRNMMIWPIFQVPLLLVYREFSYLPRAPAPSRYPPSRYAQADTRKPSDGAVDFFSRRGFFCPGDFWENIAWPPKKRTANGFLRICQGRPHFGTWRILLNINFLGRAVSFSWSFCCVCSDFCFDSMVNIPPGK